jgi:hypothetical protein
MMSVENVAAQDQVIETRETQVLNALKIKGKLLQMTKATHS